MDDLELVNLGKFRKTPFSKLSLSIKHEKLLKKICSLNSTYTKKIPETVGGILDLDIHEFSEAPFIGELYVKQLISLKRKLLKEIKKTQPDIKKTEPDVCFTNKAYRFCVIPGSLSELRLNYRYLKRDHIRLISKLERIYDSPDIEGLLDCDPVKLKEKKGVSFGIKYSTALKQLQDLIRKEIIHDIESINKPAIDQTKLIISSKVDFYDMSKIDEILIEDIEAYLCSLNKKQKYIALSRWGFNCKNKTLEKIGERYDLTRERVRQLEKNINLYLSLYLRIHPDVLRANILENIELDLIASLPFLAQCFYTEKLFYSFIEICCKMKKGSLIEILENQK